MLLRIITALLLLNTFVCQSAEAKSGTGIGVIVGEPTGLSIKFNAGGQSGLALAAAWNSGRSDSIYLHGDYVFHNYSILSSASPNLSLYYGLGAKARFLSNFGNLGIRVPLGIDFNFKEAPLNIFAEVVPGLTIIPGTSFNVDGAVGIRFII